MIFNTIYYKSRESEFRSASIVDSYRFSVLVVAVSNRPLEKTRGEYSVAKVKVFLSFEFDRDADLYRNFFAQARRVDLSHDIEDYSLNEAYRPHDESWLKKARKQIDLSDIVIVVLGDDTHNAPGVEKEMTIKNQLYKPGFQIRPTSRTSGPVRGAGDVVPWDWKKIDKKISECLKK